MNKRQFQDSLKDMDTHSLEVAERWMAVGVRESQSKLAFVRRELKRRKRRDAANLLLEDGWTP